MRIKKFNENLNNDKVTEFKKEFKELLEKYNAEISSIIEGDTHGIDYEALVVEIDDKEVLRVENCCISHWDVK
jgi:hypothetical protein